MSSLFAKLNLKSQPQILVVAAPPSFAKHSTGDPILWFAYPKASSRRYACDFNRDSGWDVLRGLGFDSVRQVAIDEDWSALRFRRVQYIGGGRKRA